MSTKAGQFFIAEYSIGKKRAGKCQQKQVSFSLLNIQEGTNCQVNVNKIRSVFHR